MRPRGRAPVAARRAAPRSRRNRARPDVTSTVTCPSHCCQSVRRRWAKTVMESEAYHWPERCTVPAERRCSHDDVSMRRPTHVGQVPHLRSAAVRLPRHDSVAVEVLPLRPLALARPVDDAGGPECHGRSGGGETGRVSRGNFPKHLGILQLRLPPGFRRAPRGSLSRSP